MEEISISADADIQTTHFFIYKGRSYPFNLVLFNLFSQYFISCEFQIKDSTSINLLEDYEDDLDLSEASIKDFIDYCQKKKIILNKENVPSLLKLAKKYMVQSLIKFITKFISNHPKDFAIQYIKMNQEQQNFNSEEYEEIISNYLNEYISNDQLISLPLPILHRIVTKYQLKNVEESPEFIEFLFKCLDHFGRPASILFDHFDFGKSNSEVLNKLLNEYSEKFDFHFINPVQLKTVYELESEIVQREMKTKKEIDQIKLENKLINEKMAEMKSASQEEALRRQLLEEMRKETQRIIQMYEDKVKEKEKLIDDQKSEFSKQLDDLREQVRKLSEKVEEKSGLIEKLKEESEKISCRPSISHRFTSESDTNGIISLLYQEVALSAGGHHNPSNPLSNITKHDDSDFYNYCGPIPQSESGSYIEFDFGPTKRIDLFSYFIRSNHGDPSVHHHPKTWRIEGSNDNDKWTRLDRRVNDSNLNGKYKQHNFECQENKHGVENRYRYIRYVQENEWLEGYPYCIRITYFELFGDIY